MITAKVAKVPESAIDLTSLLADLDIGATSDNEEQTTMSSTNSKAIALNGEASNSPTAVNAMAATTTPIGINDVTTGKPSIGSLYGEDNWPHDIRLFCVSRLNDPNQIKDISSINTTRDVIEYLIYRVCLPAVTADVLYGIALIVDNLVAANNLSKTLSSHNTETTSAINLGDDDDMADDHASMSAVSNTNAPMIDMTNDDEETISTALGGQNTQSAETDDENVSQNPALDVTLEYTIQTDNDQESSTVSHEKQNSNDVDSDIHDHAVFVVISESIVDVFVNDITTKKPFSDTTNANSELIDHADMTTKPSAEVDDDDESLTSRKLLELLDNMTARELIQLFIGSLAMVAWSTEN